MIKYLSEAGTTLENLKRGVESNAVKWQNQPYTPETIQAEIDRLKVKEREIESLKERLATAIEEGHNLAYECEDYAARVELIATGLEGFSQDKLNIYGIRLRKEVSKKARPERVIIPTIQDDTDGVGFILTTQIDPDAEQYEWEKGIGADASKPDVAPELKHFTITTKSSFVDDDVPRGLRIYYRVRAANRAGKGPWSEVVSKVQ